MEGKGLREGERGQDEGKEGVKICRRADIFGIKKKTVDDNPQIIYCENTLLHFHTHYIKNQEGEAPTINSDQLRQKEIIITS